VHLPTPLEQAPRLSEMLGVDLLIKREDLAGLCVGGNKARLLEFALGSLRAKGVDTLIAHAAAQSNKLRDIAAAAARFGMRAVLLIPASRGATETLPPQGNRLLFDILGADVRLVAPNFDAASIMISQEEVRDEMAREGRRPPSSTAASNMEPTRRSPMSTPLRSCLVNSRPRGKSRIRCSSRLAPG